ncbi:hypothetical protein [Pseudonocardia endophytica]|uniref:Uncharacterized protein n=1 Tax=Pseudonocardia endophytica TaxID=401976 RepID=A0A4R1HKZ9_PSEEN|nr:hypothetical protein [Pseudonocardia endophytica]TCK21751.1 hypothetical protein EV378_5742 [Pseudonocardia endophytica]
MNSDDVGQHHPAPRSGITPAVAVLLWVFPGWPISWVLLAAAGVPVGILFGIGITIAMIVYVSRAGSAPRPVAYVPPQALPRHLTVRREVESLAVVDAAGGCGWCGSRIAHVNDDGHLIPPRYWHTVEIEERIRTKLQG